jgi:uncharacterized protein YdaU (DUF1376 family)
VQTSASKKRVATGAATLLQGPQLVAGGGPTPGPVARAATPDEVQTNLCWEQAKADVQRLWTLSQELQTSARAERDVAAFKQLAELAQESLEEAEDKSSQARQKRMAAVGALPMVELQAPEASELLMP